MQKNLTTFVRSLSITDPKLYNFVKAQAHCRAAGVPPPRSAGLTQYIEERDPDFFKLIDAAAMNAPSRPVPRRPPLWVAALLGLAPVCIAEAVAATTPPPSALYFVPGFILPAVVMVYDLGRRWGTRAGRTAAAVVIASGLANGCYWTLQDAATLLHHPGGWGISVLFAAALYALSGSDPETPRRSPPWFQRTATGLAALFRL